MHHAHHCCFLAFPEIVGNVIPSTFVHDTICDVATCMTHIPATGQLSRAQLENNSELPCLCHRRINSWENYLNTRQTLSIDSAIQCLWLQVLKRILVPRTHFNHLNSNLTLTTIIDVNRKSFSHLGETHHILTKRTCVMS